MERKMELAVIEPSLRLPMTWTKKAWCRLTAESMVQRKLGADTANSAESMWRRKLGVVSMV